MLRQIQPNKPNQLNGDNHLPLFMEHHTVSSQHKAMEQCPSLHNHSGKHLPLSVQMHQHLTMQ
jgi:hypothetical protein